MKMDFAEFLEKMKKVSRLTGYPIEQETVGFLHKEVENEDRSDILYALRDLTHNGERPTLANIFRHLNIHRSARLERESQKFKEQEKRECEMTKEEVKKLVESVIKMPPRT